MITKLNSKRINIFIQKRNYPGNNNNTKIIINARNVLTPKINYNTQLQRYMPRSTTVLCRPLNNIKNIATVFERKNINIDPFLKNNSLDIVLAKLKLISEDSIDFNTQIFIRKKIENNEKISDDQLIQILIKLKEIENLNIIQKGIIYELKTYFKDNHPTMNYAKLFLEIWHKNNCEFNALNFQKKITSSNENTTNDQKKDNKKSLTHKKEEKEIEILTIVTKMKEFFLKVDEEPENLKSSIILMLLKDWIIYLKNRSNMLPLTEDEIEINNKLKILYEKHGPKQEDVLGKIKDNLKILKEKSTLIEELKRDPIEKCFIPEDYIQEITRINNILSFLEINTSLSKEDIKLLTINSSAAIIDAEGTFKLTQEAYNSFAANKDFLGFEYMDVKPNVFYILTQIKNKNYEIIDEYKNKTGSLIDIAYLGHKSMVVTYNSSGKNLKIRTGLLTSTKDENTFLLDEYQQTNPDNNKQNKNQYFRILSHFIVVDEKEPLVVDLETTLLLHSNNNNNEDITEILVKFYEDKQNIWSNNNYQLSYNANEEFLHKIAIIFYKKQLLLLQDGLQNLEEELNKLSFKEASKKFEILTQEKLKYMEDKKFQQYISLLPLQYQELYKALNFFKLKKQKEDIRKEKQKLKKKKEDAMSLKKTNKENETNLKTAKDKKDDYVKNKQKLLDE